MYLSNLARLIKMAFDPAVMVFLLKLHRFYSEDKVYSIYKFIKSILNMLKGEKIQYHEKQYILTSFLPPLPSKAFFQLVQATDKKKSYYSQHMMADTSAPISFFLNLTNRCPLNCVHCSAKGRKNDQDLNTQQWKKVITQIQLMGSSIIGFTGGEPLLRDDLEEIISSVTPLSKTLLFTCGKALDQERANKLKEAGLFGAAISIDSAIAEEHDKQRGHKGSFDSAITAIKHCRQAGLYTMMQTVILKENLNQRHFFSICRLAQRLSVQEIRVLEPIKSGKFFKDSNEIFYTNEDRKNLIELHHKANKIPGFPKISTFAHTESQEKYGCGAGIQHSYINSNGDLYPCDFVPISFGNIKNQALKPIWDQMKQAFKKPHSSCFAMANFNKIAEKTKNKSLPLNKEEGMEICFSCIPEEYPKYYRILQGSK